MTDQPPISRDLFRPRRFQLPGLAFLALAGACWFLRPGAPVLLWLLPFLFTMYCCIRVWLELAAEQRRLISFLASLCLAANIVTLVLSPEYDPSRQTYWRDDHDYYRQSIALTEAWEEGFYPEISRKGSPPYMGTLHTGYQRALSGVFYATHNSVLAGRMLNSLGGAALVLLSALMAHLLFGNGQRKRSPPYYSPPIIAALLATVHPTQFYYGQFLLKDVYTAAWFMAAAVVTMVAVSRRDLAAAVASLAAIYILFTVRAYAALSLVAGAGAYLLLCLPRRAALISGAVGALGLFMLIRYTDRGSMQAAQMWHSLMELAPAHARSAGAIAKHLAMGVPRLLLAPFSWIYALGDRPLYALYPAMWFLYLLVYPALFLGLWRAIRQNITVAAVPLMGLIGGSFVLLIASYGGDAPRQRFYMEYIAIAFAALGWIKPRPRVFIFWYGILAVYAVGQFISVKMRGL